jgi:hypothetical protein
MLERCRRPGCPNYPRYGGRGISYIPAWESYDAFWADMAPTWQPGLSIERRDNNGNYTPANCLWVSAAEQARNKRTNVRVRLLGGATVILTDLARELGLNPPRLRRMLAKGNVPMIFGQPAFRLAE